jgi:hypothetical protein
MTAMVPAELLPATFRAQTFTPRKRVGPRPAHERLLDRNARSIRKRRRSGDASSATLAATRIAEGIASSGFMAWGMDARAAQRAYRPADAEMKPGVARRLWRKSGFALQFEA